MRGYGKLVLLITVCIAVSALSGCLPPEWRRKFVRKNAVKEAPAYYHIEEYPEKPYKDRYQNYYTYWHNWHMELARREMSHRKRISSAQGALDNLIGMRLCLVDEKGVMLDEQIVDMQDVVSRIENGRSGDVYGNTRIRRTLDKVERFVVNNFGYKSMQDHIKKGP